MTSAGNACPVVPKNLSPDQPTVNQNPTLTAREVKQILQQTADKITDTTTDPQLGTRYGTYNQQGHSQWFGYGRVNAYRAVMAAKQRLWQGRTYTRTVEFKDESLTPIPDHQAAGVSRTRQIRTAGTVQDLTVQVALQHDYLGDVEVHLQLPTGQELLLQGRTLGNQRQLDYQSPILSSE